MKRVVQIVITGYIFLFISYPMPNIAASNHSELVQEVLNVVKAAMPDDWKIAKIDYTDKPYWSFSDDKCMLMEIYGPRMGGADYYNTANNNKIFITRRYITNESRSIWISTDGFNPEWTILNRIKNRLSKTPVPYPEKLSVINDLTIYGEGRFEILLKQNEDIEKTSPPGTNLAEPVRVEEGGSWPTWIEDIRNSLNAIRKK